MLTENDESVIRCVITFPVCVLTDGTECLRAVANATNNIENDEMVDTTNRPTVTFSNRINAPVAVTSILSGSIVSGPLVPDCF